MKLSVVVSLVAIVISVFAMDAQAHRRYPRSHIGVYFGSPYWWGPSPYFRHYPPYYYEPRTIIIERDPPIYIQRPSAPTQSPAPTTSTNTPVWYYCGEPAGYYPYVQDCAQSWVRVDPRTVAPPPRD